VHQVSNEEEHACLPARNRTARKTSCSSPWLTAHKLALYSLPMQLPCAALHAAVSKQWLQAVLGAADIHLEHKCNHKCKHAPVQ
jgi:hypothetical protein